MNGQTIEERAFLEVSEGMVKGEKIEFCYSSS
jgi:hypothetical protein